MRTGKRIGIFTFREQEHFHVKTLLQDNINSPQRGFDPCFVAIIEHRDIFCKPLYEPDLVCCKSSTRRSYHILYTRLVQADHIGVPFYQEATIFLYNSRFSLEKAIQHVAFMVDLRFGRVDVFGGFLILFQDTAAEADYLSRYAVDGEDHPAGKSVELVSVLVNG